LGTHPTVTNFIVGPSIGVFR